MGAGVLQAEDCEDEAKQEGEQSDCGRGFPHTRLSVSTLSLKTIKFL